MGKLTLAQTIEKLDWSIDLFSVQNFHNAANEIKKMKKELQGKKNNVILDSTFRVLQATFIVEYNTTPHRIQCSDFFKKRYNAVMKINLKGLNKRTLNRNWLNSMEQRAKARKVILTLDGMLIAGLQKLNSNYIDFWTKQKKLHFLCVKWSYQLHFFHHQI